MKKLLFLLLIAFLQNISVSAQTNIRRVDFDNFTYQPICTGDDSGEIYGQITVKNGKFENVKEVNGVTQTINDELPSYFEVNDAIYGDINGDGKEEAVIISTCNTGGTGQFSEGYIYTLKNGKPVLMTRFAGGDRGFGGIMSVKFVRNMLSVERNDPEGGSNCCAAYTLTIRFRWNGKRLVSVGKPVRHKIKQPND